MRELALIELSPDARQNGFLEIVSSFERVPLSRKLKPGPGELTAKTNQNFVSPLVGIELGHTH
jgi:hypothetical protein